MRKLLLVIAVALFSFSANAQSGFSLGANVALPVGNASNVSSFAIGADVTYMFTSGEEFNYGLASGYHLFLGKTIAGTKTNYSFLPIAAAGRYTASESFVVGADLGYAIGMSPTGNDGGFYYRPMVGYNIGENMQLNAFYSGVSNNGTFSSLGVGIMFEIGRASCRERV